MQWTNCIIPIKTYKMKEIHQKYTILVLCISHEANLLMVEIHQMYRSLVLCISHEVNLLIHSITSQNILVLTEDYTFSPFAHMLYVVHVVFHVKYGAFNPKKN